MIAVNHNEQDKPLLYDICCSAGGCTKGYQEAGFYVVGIDIAPQPHYIGDGFIQMDAIEFLTRYLAGEFREAAVFSASPPCQGYSVTAALPNVNAESYPKLIPQIRELLIKTDKPYVIENVPGAPLNAPLKLIGHHFGLKIIRERWFETNPWLMSPGFVKPKNIKTHSYRAYSSFKNGATHITLAGHNFSAVDGAIAVDIDWMNREELAQAIPPAYTRYIGERLMEIIA
jgi:DNA (cytosine-5)-methyltransferase 1